MITLPGYKNISTIYESQSSLLCRGIREADSLQVVIKILKKDFPPPKETARFRQEYRLASKTTCKGVIKALSFEDFDHHLAIIYEDFGGEQLATFLTESPLSQIDFLEIAIKCVQALGELHAHKITHKDINPTNILFNRETNQLKIIDLGISTSLSFEQNYINDINKLEGTLAYISPEQTGRMNRASDYRSDFYSLGVTFYELLCHLLPFSSCDPLEIIHCHLACTPLAPHKMRHDISPTLSAIIMKMMAKNAEERYQSCLGIEEDLKECHLQLKTNNAITPFPLAKNDFCDTFTMSQKMYGRDEEISVLANAWNRSTEGRNEFALITGAAGCGKTALVFESFKQINMADGYFIRGKSDEFKKDIPYFGIASALSKLVLQILNEDKEKLDYWRDTILQAVEPNGAVLTALVPEVEDLIGVQPSMESLDPLNAENRFNLVIKNFLRATCSASHPFCLFLDDLQWTDSATLRLLEAILTDPSMGHIFIIGSCRDDTTDIQSNALNTLLGRLSSEAIDYAHLKISLLTKDDICLLLADTLPARKNVLSPLAFLVYAKTLGNPFYVKLFIQGLFEAGIIRFNHRDMSWNWSLSQVEVVAMTDNVADLLTTKIEHFSHTAKDILKIATCIGHHFELTLLAKIADRPLQQCLSSLQEAIREGLIVSLPGTYILAMTEEELQAEKDVAFIFAHDRIQHLLYTTISDFEKGKIHLKIGNFLYQHISEEGKKEDNFTVVNHLNLSLNFITEQVERDSLIQLNLSAARRARNSAAWEQTMHYLQVGIALLGKDCWQTSYDTALMIYSEAAESAYLCGRYAEMDQLIGVVLKNGRELLDTVFVYEVKIQACKAQYEIQEAVSTALILLKMLDVSFPESPNTFHAMLSLQRINLSLLGHDIEDLINAPAMKDPVCLAATSIISHMGSAVYFVEPQLLPLLVFTGVNMSIKHGNAPESAFLYATCGMIHCGVLNNIPKGLRYGRLALEVLDSFGSKKIQAMTLHMVYAFIIPWEQHLENTLTPLNQGYQCGLESGDFEYAGFCAYFFCYHLFLSGTNLLEIETETKKYSDTIGTLQHETSQYVDAIFRQTIVNIRNGNEESDIRLSGDIYNEVSMLPIHKKANDKTTLFFLYCSKLILNFIFSKYSKAVENAAECEHFLDGVIGLAVVPIFYFYDSLASLAIYSDTSPQQQKRILRKVSANQKKMKTWAKHAPMNFLHKYHLVNAEKRRLLGKSAQAFESYDLAIQAAKENRYLQEEGLAYELAAVFYKKQKKNVIARAYMQSAKHCYLRWGSDAKAQQLDNEHADLLIGYTGTTTSDDIAYETITGRTLTMMGSGSGLDLASVMKASQAISGEIVLENLLRKMIEIVIENVGAQTGFLILQKDGKLVVEARSEKDTSKDRTVLQSVNLEDEPDLPHTIINNVARTRELLIANTPDKGEEFAGDPYIKQKKPKSVLCVPILHKGMLSGIVYLENNIFSNMFNQERLEVVKILCSQIAISLENAGLFSFLEESEQRYRQLYENIIDMVILVDQDKKILLTNPLFYYVFGIQEADRKDLMFLDWVHPEDVNRVTNQMLAQDGDSDFVRDFNFRMIHGDSVIEVECNTKRIRKGDSIQFQMVIRDITKRKRLQQNLLDSLQDVHKARVGTILGLAKLAEYRDKDTGSHLERIREYARIIAIEMGKLIEYEGYITPQYIDDLYLSSILHDIGKVGIPDSILLKPGKLSAEEFEIMKRHTTYGGDALHSVEEQTEGQSFLALGKAIAFHHHEKWDGSGYPDGLKEDEIPLSTRIVALVDVYDALTSKRSYKEAFSHETAREMIISNRATHFAPDVVDAFLKSEDQFIRIREELLSDFPDDVHSTIH